MNYYKNQQTHVKLTLFAIQLPKSIAFNMSNDVFEEYQSSGKFIELVEEVILTVKSDEENGFNYNIHTESQSSHLYGMIYLFQNEGNEVRDTLQADLVLNLYNKLKRKFPDIKFSLSSSTMFN